MNSILERRNLDINLELIFLFNYSFITIKNSDIKDECAICLETMYKKDIIKTSCEHCFHKECLINQLNSNLSSKNKCCVCRTDLIQDYDFRNNVLSPLPYMARSFITELI